MYSKFLLDLVDAYNKISYRDYDCNIKQTLITMKRSSSDALKDMPNCLKELNRLLIYVM